MTEITTDKERHDHVMVCAYHPNRETGLRCNRCDKPICASCAVRTPTGYRCQECVRAQQRVFSSVAPQDYVIAPLVAGGLAFLGALIVPRLGFFVIFLAPAAGAVIAEAVRYAIKRRRSKGLFQLTTAAVIVGSLLPICGPLFAILMSFLSSQGGFGLSAFGFGLLWHGVYVFMATSAVYYRLSGLRI